MYEIRKISFDYSNGGVLVQNGIEFTRFGERVVLTESFWGVAIVNNIIPIKTKLLTYTTSYKFTPTKTGKIKLTLNYGKEDEFEGFLVFVNMRSSISETDGEILFKKGSQGVFVLKEGQYIKIGSNRLKLEVQNGKLVNVY